MRMKMVCDDRTLQEVANEFLALKKAQKVRERTLSDYKKYIDKFLAQSQNTLDVDVLKIEILEYFADIPKTSPARFNHPYQYLHALFEWCAKQDYYDRQIPDYYEGMHRDGYEPWQILHAAHRKIKKAYYAQRKAEEAAI